MQLIFLQCLISLIAVLEPDYSLSPSQLGIANKIWKASENPAELLAIGFIESRFRQEAVSPKGATGVFQIMPIAEKEIQILLNKPLTRDELDDNIIIGSEYWALMKARYGNLKDAIVGYNAGHTWVGKGKLPKETEMYWQKFNKMLQAATCDDTKTNR